MSALTCNRCGSVRDQQDNFCRRCGHQLTVNLPAVRPPSLPARSQALPPTLIGSVAVLAVGTGLEWLARRLAGSAARAAGRKILAQERRPAKQVEQPDVVVNEALYVRRVELRR
jgi:hypothetical protein